MAVNVVSSSTNTNNTTNSQAAAASKTATVNYNSFLKLLIAQIKAQDPTDPMKASEQIAQLATFSQVEQSVKMNTNLENLIQSQGLAQASSVIGKTVTSADGSVSGVVKEVRIASDGVVATTTEGKQIMIESGIKIKG
ncbi:flagellar hook assembly protein FlgD [Gellertiella hungarica]|uniref:Basal-body rod modification protein FlgD n=1 Tax=Gellertiella hungarica TaxID=1572859 RepID=A0A7W6J590_9HYPH|nr:flagellar hook assembly protein FlgD [Gellertiella hungarica]MBB4064143.1 flagellar basal-body rod modification protein FlgD [Gellertiella hungarica]